MGFVFIFNSVFLLSFLFSSCYPATSRISLSRGSINTIYQIGDSLSDTGNAKLANGNLQASRSPYGETYPGYPTGRWSNGRLIIDYTADFFGLESLNPFLKQNASFQSGVNFAFAGATAVEASILIDRYGISFDPVPDLTTQIRWFKTYLGSLCSTKSECRDKLRDSLIFFGEIGGNEINYGISSNKTLDQLHDLISSITQAIIQGLKEVISMGASRVFVPGNFAIGCIPSVIDGLGSEESTIYDDFGCNVAANQLAVYQNTELQIALKNLSLEFLDVKIVYLDYYNAFINLLTNVPYNGFDKHTLLQACCGSKDNKRSREIYYCGPGVPVCQNPNGYINWDGLHLTQEAYAQIFNFIAPSMESSFVLNMEM